MPKLNNFYTMPKKLDFIGVFKIFYKKFPKKVLTRNFCKFIINPTSLSEGAPFDGAFLAFFIL